MQLTAGELIDNARSLAGADGLQFRHPDDLLLSILSEEHGMLQLLVTNCGERMFTSRVTAVVPTTVTTTGDTFTSVPWASDLASLQLVEVQRNGRWYALERAAFDYAGEDFATLSAAEPTHWAIGSLPVAESNGTITAGTINIYPASTLGRTVRLTFQKEAPVFASRTALVYLLNAAWKKWLQLSVAIRIHLRDEESEQVAAKLTIRQGEEDILKASLQRTTRLEQEAPQKVRYR